MKKFLIFFAKLDDIISVRFLTICLFFFLFIALILKIIGGNKIAIDKSSIMTKKKTEQATDQQQKIIQKSINEIIIYENKIDSLYLVLGANAKRTRPTVDSLQRFFNNY